MEQEKQKYYLLDGKVSLDEINEVIRSLPKHIRKMLPEDDCELIDCIELLPDSISKGRVLKITIDDYLNREDEAGKGTEDDRTGTATGLLYALDDDVKIKTHKHTKDMETYVAIEKVLKLPAELDGKQQELSANICAIDSEHGIYKMSKGTLIGTFKVRKDCLEKQVKSKEREMKGPLYKKGSKEQCKIFDEAR